MKKTLATLLTLSVLFLSAPQTTHAQYTDIANALKEYGLDTVAYVAAKTVTRKLTQKTVNWINSGFKGNPGYLTDPEQFFLDAGDNVASQFLSQAGVNKLCSPFKAQVRLALTKNYINDDTTNYSCTLSILENNFDNFTQDFTQGGWQGWFEITQNQQNNPYGAYLAAKNSLAVQVGTEVGSKAKEVDLGSGFLTLKRCPKGEETYIGAQKYCKVKEESVTPGTVVSDQIKETLGTKWGELVSADEFNEIVTALVSQLIEQVAGNDNGLRGASEKPTAGTGNASKSLVDQIADESQPYQNYQISASQPTLTCAAGGGGSGQGVDTDGDGIIDSYTGGTGGTVSCETTPAEISGIPAWPLGSGGSGGSSCPAYTPNPSIDCTKVDGGTVLGILNKYPLTNAGMTSAEAEVKGIYPWAFVIPHRRLDKFDFGNGMAVDVMVGAVGGTGSGKSWTWNVECACNRNPAGSAATNPPIPLPGVGTYTLTIDVSQGGSVSDGVDTCANLSNPATTTCSKPYPIDSLVQITAQPAFGRSFVGWTGPCAVFNPSNTCRGNITGNGQVGAIFR